MTQAMDVISGVSEPLRDPVRIWPDDQGPVDVQTAADAALTFTSGEAARLIALSDGYLRQLSLSSGGPQPSNVSRTGRRGYMPQGVNALRVHLAAQGGANTSSICRVEIRWLEVFIITRSRAAVPPITAGDAQPSGTFLAVETYAQVLCVSMQICLVSMQLQHTRPDRCEYDPKPAGGNEFGCTRGMRLGRRKPV
jgi:hypothetical protein